MNPEDGAFTLKMVIFLITKLAVIFDVLFNLIFPYNKHTGFVHFISYEFLFEDDNFGHNNIAYDKGRDENLRDVVADINGNLELQAVGNGDALQPMRISMTI